MTPQEQKALGLDQPAQLEHGVIRQPVHYRRQYVVFVWSWYGPIPGKKQVKHMRISRCVQNDLPLNKALVAEFDHEAIGALMRRRNQALDRYSQSCR